jgi:hypothetical protein
MLEPHPGSHPILEMDAGAAKGRDHQLQAVPGAEATVGKQRKWRHNFQKIPQDDTEQ